MEIFPTKLTTATINYNLNEIQNLLLYWNCKAISIAPKNVKAPNIKKKSTLFKFKL